MTLAELYKELERHDWFHARSDSREVYQRGRSKQIELLTAARKVVGGEELYTAFAKHKFSGPAFGTPKEPKPEMPKEQVCGEGWGSL